MSIARGWERLGAQKFVLEIKNVKAWMRVVSIVNVASERQAIKHSIISSSFKASMTSRERNRCETELRGRKEIWLPSVLLLQHSMLSYIIWADITKTSTCPTSSEHALY